jgi:hypothetical protein
MVHDSNRVRRRTRRCSLPRTAKLPSQRASQAARTPWTSVEAGSPLSRPRRQSLRASHIQSDPLSFHRLASGSTAVLGRLLSRSPSPLAIAAPIAAYLRPATQVDARRLIRDVVVRADAYSNHARASKVTCQCGMRRMHHAR